MASYTISLGGYSFTAFREIDVACDEVVRTNKTPNALVARNYRWIVFGRFAAGTPALTATALLALLTAAVNNPTIVTSFKVLDAAAAAVAQIGDVRTGTAENWEDLRVTSFECDGAPVADCVFTIGFSARRSFPDADGVCELEVDWRGTEDEFGNATRTRVTTIRLAKSSANTIAGADGKSTGTAAIAAQLKEPLPIGWRRTKGDLTRGYTVHFPLWPLLHLAICESEVVRNAGGANPPTGASKATTSTRTVDDPERGVRRITHTAESVGAADGLGWVEDVLAGFGDGVGDVVLEELPEEKTYRGQLRRLEPLVTPTRGLITREKRTFQRVGGEREGGATLMSAPHLPTVTVGPWTAVRVAETVQLYALGVAGDGDIPLPDPLPSPWRLVEPSLFPEASVNEDSRYPSQRLWSRGAVREYLWGGAADDPRANAAYLNVLFADGQATL